MRDQLQDISDEVFSGHPSVIEARERLAALDAEHRARVSRVVAFRAAVEKLTQLRESAIAEMTRLDHLRPEVILSAFLANDGMAKDDEIRRNIKAKKLEINRVDLALPLLHRKIDAAQAEADQTASQAETIADNLREMLDASRLSGRPAAQV